MYLTLISYTGRGSYFTWEHIKKEGFFKRNSVGNISCSSVFGEAESVLLNSLDVDAVYVVELPLHGMSAGQIWLYAVCGCQCGNHFSKTQETPCDAAEYGKAMYLRSGCSGQ